MCINVRGELITQPHAHLDGIEIPPSIDITNYKIAKIISKHAFTNRTNV